MTTQQRCQAVDEDNCPFHGTHKNNGNVKVMPITEFFGANTTVKPTPLKEMGFVHLAQTIVTESTLLNNISIQRVSSSIELAAYLHRDDWRSNRGKFDKTPYIEHPLRNALRVMRYGCRKESVIIATVLHDTVEDHAFEISKEKCGKPTLDENEARENAYTYIHETYGSEVARIVRGMSNPIEDEPVTVAEKHQRYVDHVIEAIKDNDVFVSKFSDYVDNAVGLYHNASHMKPESIVKKATKYALLYDAFKSVLDDPKRKIPVSVKGRQEMIRQLEAGRIRLAKLKETYSVNSGL